jgi:hypothetical protein
MTTQNAEVAKDRQESLTLTHKREVQEEKTHTFTITPEHEAAYEAKWRGIAKISSLIAQLEQEMAAVYVASKKLPQLPEGVEVEDFVLQTFGLLSNTLFSLYIDGESSYLDEVENSSAYGGYSKDFVQRLMSISFLAEDYTKYLWAEDSDREVHLDEEVYEDVIGEPVAGWGRVFQC